MCIAAFKKGGNVRAKWTSFCDKSEKAGSESLLINHSQSTSSCHQVCKYKDPKNHTFCVLILCGLFTKRTRGAPVAVIGGWLARCPLTRIGVEERGKKVAIICSSASQEAKLAWNIPNKSIRQWLAGMSLTFKYQLSYTQLSLYFAEWHSRTPLRQGMFWSFLGVDLTQAGCSYHRNQFKYWPTETLTLRKPSNWMLQQNLILKAKRGSWPAAHPLSVCSCLCSCLLQPFFWHRMLVQVFTFQPSACVCI